MQLHQFQISEFSPIEFTPDAKRALLLLHGWTIFCKTRDGGKRFDYYHVCPCDGSEFDSLKKAQAHLCWSWKILLDDIDVHSRDIALSNYGNVFMDEDAFDWIGACVVGLVNGLREPSETGWQTAKVDHMDLPFYYDLKDADDNGIP